MLITKNVKHMKYYFLYKQDVEDIYENILRNVGEESPVYPQTIENYLGVNNLDTYEAKKLLSLLGILYLESLPNPRLLLDCFVDYQYIMTPYYENGTEVFRREVDFVLLKRGEALLDRIFELYPCGPLQIPITE